MHRSAHVLLRLIALLCIPALFTSCATIFSATRSTVPVRSEPSGAAITILDRDSNIVFRGHTPAMVELRSAKGYFRRGIYTVRINTEDHQTHEQVMRATISGWFWANLLFPGFLGMLIIDPITGAMYSLKGRQIFAQLWLDPALPEKGEQ